MNKIFRLIKIMSRSKFFIMLKGTFFRADKELKNHLKLIFFVYIGFTHVSLIWFKGNEYQILKKFLINMMSHNL